MSGLDLSITALMKACHGNVETLPSFMVHDNSVWPSGVVRTDSKGRVHLRRSTFLQVVVGEVPVRAGLWLRADLQEFHIDLQPHHLQGSADAKGGNARQAARAVAKADHLGRVEGDDGYGDAAPRDYRQSDIAADVAEAKERGKSRDIGSTVFAGVSSE